MSRGKLVRDGIPDLIRAEGRVPETRVLGTGEYVDELRLKLAEETGEYLDSQEAEELADILEVVYALAEADGIGARGLDAIRSAKREERGGFDGRVFLAGC